MKKYTDANSRMLSSTCISVGTAPLRPSASAVNAVPVTSTASTACAAARFARFSSPAPKERAMNARKPMLSAETELPISQLTVLVAPTAAVACVPSEPTIAVSIYCTAVCISCSSMVGHARDRMTAIIPKLSRLESFLRISHTSLSVEML